MDTALGVVRSVSPCATRTEETETREPVQIRPLCHNSGNGVKEHTGYGAGGLGATRERQMERFVKSPGPYPFPDHLSTTEVTYGLLA